MEEFSNKIFNQSQYKIRRQALRHQMSEPEKYLWQVLRNQQMGVKFRRQHGIGHYIVDFYCPELKLVIEVDGESHFSEEGRANDNIRDQFMLALGIITLRFKNKDVIQDIDAIQREIKHKIGLITNNLATE